MAYVPADQTAPGTDIEIDIRGRRVKAADCFHAFLQESQMSYPADLKYTKDHEWVKIDGASAKVGLPTTRRSSSATSSISSCRRWDAR
jgi:hypothetical protein